MIRRLPLIAWLALVWVELWADASLGTILAALAVGAAVVWLLPPTDPGPRGTVRPLRAAWFGLFFLWKLIESSAVVAWEVVTPRNRLNQGIVAVPIRGVSDTLVTLVANAISLTPGTLTLEVRTDPTVLYVHVMHLRDIEDVRRDALHLEALAIRAFGNHEAVEQLR